MLRYWGSLVIPIFLVAVIASCGKPDGPSSSRTAENPKVLRFDVNAPFASLDPTDVYASGSTVVFPLLYSYLFVPNSDSKLEPDLALKWGYDPKSFTWTVYLRQDASFHNNKPVTAMDVEYSLKVPLKNMRPFLFALIERVSVLSDNVITISLKKSDPGFLEKIWDMEILPKPGEGKIDFYNHPIGSGPFKFKDRKGENEVTLEANEDYFHGRPSLDGVAFYFQPNKERAWTRLLAGETDIAQEISPKNYEIIKECEDRFYFDLYPLEWYTIVLYNIADPLFSDLRVRQALAHAIDREYIVSKILGGLGVVAVGPMGINSPYRNPEVKPVPYDPRRGQHLLEKAGWSQDDEGHYLKKDNKNFEFTLCVSVESQIEKRVARYLQLCLNDLGIRVHLESIPFAELTKRYYRNNAFQAVLTEISGVYRDPEFMGAAWCPHLSQRSEAAGFEHPEVTRLIREALDETDPVRQKELFYKIDGLITSLQPGTFLFHKTVIDVMAKRFTLPSSFSLTYEGIWRLRHASVEQD